MPTPSNPDVPLPAGTRVVIDWDAEDGRRVLASNAMQVEYSDPDLLVTCLVSQGRDGSLIDAEGDHPQIIVDEVDERTGDLKEILSLSVEECGGLIRALADARLLVAEWLAVTR